MTPICNAPYTPSGVTFFDSVSGRVMMLVDDSEQRESLRGWLLYWHDGYKNWVTLRRASDADVLAVTHAHTQRGSDD